MKRSGAIGVVVAVLAAAALLMYFVVMPQIRGSKTVEDLAKKAGETVEGAKNAVNDAGKQVEDVVSGAEEAKSAFVSKMARVKSDAETATKELEAALAKATPTPEELAAAKAKLESALKAAADVKLPEDVDAATAALAAKGTDAAKSALAALEKLPADPAAAKAAIADLKASIQSSLPGGKANPDAADDSSAPRATQDVAKLDGTIVDDAAKTTDAAQSVDPAKTTDAAKPALPAFDIVRVEKDGSTVIAGRAEAGAKVEIMDDGKVIATAEADDTGAFAAVLDVPLAAGDHSIVIKSTTKDGKSTSSEEVATVSVPKDGKGELLAMVTKPGEASKIVTMPEGDKATEIAANKGVTADAAKPADAAATVKTPDLPALSSEIASNPPVVAGDDQAKADAQQVAKADTSAPADAARTTADPARAPEVLVSAVEIEGDRIFVAGNAAPNATVRVYADDKLVAEVKADENGRFVADNTMQLAVGNHTIRADVLSADGAKVAVRASVPFFRPEGDLAAVASAEPAKNETAVEQLPSGTFDKALDEAGKALGLLKDLYAGGRTPTAEELAAARSSTEIALKTLSEVKVASNADPALAEMASKAAEEASKALDALKALPADATAVKSALDTIEKDVGAALKPAAELAASVEAKQPVADPVKPADSATSTSTDAATDVVKPADTAAAADAAKPADTAASTETAKAPEDGSVVSDSAQPGEVTTAQKDTITTDEAAKADATKDKSADSATTDVSTTADGAASTSSQENTAGKSAADATQEVAVADQPKVIEQAPLTQSQDSVIIRRGDTLWQISRRVYGAGVRYTTIYMANQSQITDPDRIMPGQIFSMPGKWLDNAEELHKERLGHKKK